MYRMKNLFSGKESTSNNKVNYVVTTTLPRVFGGRTKALLDRTKILIENFHSDFAILSTNYDPNFFEIRELYLKKKWITRNTKLVNMYIYFSQDDQEALDIKKNLKTVAGTLYIKGDDFYRYYHDQQAFDKKHHFLYRKFKFDNLLFEDYMMGEKRYLRKEYNHKGYCHRQVYYFKNSLLKDKELYLSSGGNIYLTKHYCNNEKNELEYIDLVFNGINYLFYNEKDLFKFFFEQIMNERSLVFCDARALDKPLVEMSKEVIKILILHNSHEDLSTKDGIKNSYRYFLNKTEDIDQIVCLTNEQRDDILALPYNISKDKISIIPHSMPDEEFEDFSTVDHKKFIYLGRLQFNSQKQVSHVIMAFKEFSKYYQDYTLEIFGGGEDKKRLKELVEKEGLESRVFFKGVSSNIKEVFLEATGTLVTSKYEGFCMVIMESLYYKCPVISYECKYGPKDFLGTKKNGYLVRENDILDFSEKMKMFVENKSFSKENVLLDNEFRFSSTLPKWQKIMVLGYK